MTKIRNKYPIDLKYQIMEQKFRYLKSNQEISSDFNIKENVLRMLISNYLNQNLPLCYKENKK